VACDFIVLEELRVGDFKSSIVELMQRVLLQVSKIFEKYVFRMRRSNGLVQDEAFNGLVQDEAFERIGSGWGVRTDWFAVIRDRENMFLKYLITSRFCIHLLHALGKVPPLLPP
jgi:hypothetical protein